MDYHTYIYNNNNNIIMTLVNLYSQSQGKYNSENNLRQMWFLFVFVGSDIYEQSIYYYFITMQCGKIIRFHNGWKYVVWL